MRELKASLPASGGNCPGSSAARAMASHADVGSKDQNLGSAQSKDTTYSEQVAACTPLIAPFFPMELPSKAGSLRADSFGSASLGN